MITGAKGTNFLGVLDTCRDIALHEGSCGNYYREFIRGVVWKGTNSIFRNSHTTNGVVWELLSSAFLSLAVG